MRDLSKDFRVGSIDYLGERTSRPLTFGCKKLAVPHWRARRNCGIILSAMTIREIIESQEFRSVVNDYRDTCLWFANNVEHPSDRLQLEQILSAIENNGDAAAFRRVGRIRQWL